MQVLTGGAAYRDGCEAHMHDVTLVIGVKLLNTRAALALCAALPVCVMHTHAVLV
jgi:hypothetical protein